VPDPSFQRVLRNLATSWPQGELEQRLTEGKPLRVKLGVDPTAPRVTLGWAVVLRKLAEFQALGHTAVLIVGDFTAQVGDPSGKREIRKRLAESEVRGYVDSVMAGLSKVLLPEPLEIRYNSEWLAPMRTQELLELAAGITVARLLEREDFALRYQTGKPISLMELFYPLLQGMDSVAVEADIELGGTDQLWNLLVGRDLQQRAGQRPQCVVTVPLLVGTDGTQKMSQSLGNYIGVDEAPDEMFGKLMSIPDTAMPDYFRLATALSSEEVETVLSELAAGSLHPGSAKRRLGREVVGVYWGGEAAEAAERAFDRVFRDKRVPEEVRQLALPEGERVHLPTLLRDAGLVASGSEAVRLLAQGAVKLDGERVTDPEIEAKALRGKTLQVGKRRFVRLV